jgi:hypothetical protein
MFSLYLNLISSDKYKGNTWINGFRWIHWLLQYGNIIKFMDVKDNCSMLVSRLMFIILFNEFHRNSFNVYFSPLSHFVIMLHFATVSISFPHLSINFIHDIMYEGSPNIGRIFMKNYLSHVYPRSNIYFHAYFSCTSIRRLQSMGSFIMSL